VLSVRGNFWERDARFVTQGTEVTLEWEAKQSGAIRWQMAVVAATGRTKLENGLNRATKAGYLGPPLTFGLSYQEPIRFQSGALMGQIWGPVYAGVDDDGEYIFEDQNGDGSFMNEEEDFAVLGNAQPSFTLGLGNTFQWCRFDVQVFFRGVFGHDLLNATRASYSSGAVTNLYNVAVGEPFNRFLKERPIINSQHVESASFLSLDNLTLSYRPGLRRADGRLDDQALRVFLNTQNLFTLTRYTGVDPEVRYGPLRSTGFGRHYSDENILSWGIDWRNTYLPARTFTFGVELTL
jgi:iron complex outermembrane receptor protein